MAMAVQQMHPVAHLPLVLGVLTVPGGGHRARLQMMRAICKPSHKQRFVQDQAVLTMKPSLHVSLASPGKP